MYAVVVLDLMYRNQNFEFFGMYIYTFQIKFAMAALNSLSMSFKTTTHHTLACPRQVYIRENSHKSIYISLLSCDVFYAPVHAGSGSHRPVFRQVIVPPPRAQAPPVQL